MNFFCDSTLSLQDALNHYISYVKRHNGVISDNFRNNLKIQILTGNETRAEANANVDTLTIKLRKNISIITFFHELRHISDQWQDKNNSKKYYGCWEHETDFDKQMRFEDVKTNTVRVYRGIHGRFLGEAIAELYASKVYWDLCNNSKEAFAYTSSRKYYDEEIINLKKICTVFGINEDIFINLQSEDDYGENFLRKKCEDLTDNNELWDCLESYLDFLEMKKVIHTSHPDLIISQHSQEDFQSISNKINQIYPAILSTAL